MNEWLLLNYCVFLLEQIKCELDLILNSMNFDCCSNLKANNFTGEWPVELNNLTKLIEL